MNDENEINETGSPDFNENDDKANSDAQGAEPEMNKEEEKKAGTTNNAEVQITAEKIGRITIGDKKNIPKGTLDDLKTQGYGDAIWTQVYSDKDKEHYQSNFAKFFGDKITFISSGRVESRWALVYDLLLKPMFAKIKRKKVFFGLGKGEDTDDLFGLFDLILSLENKKDIFLVIDLEEYLKAAQKHFLATATGEVHNKALEILKSNNIYVIMLIPKKLVHDISNDSLGMKKCFFIWEIFDTKPEEIREQDIEQLFEKLNPIEKAVMFTGVSFTDLSFRDFDFIVSLLVNNIRENMPVVMDVYKDYPDGAKLVKQVFTGNYHDIWSKNNDQFIKNCFLCGNGNAGAFVIDVKSPTLKDKMFAYLKRNQHFYWQEQCSFLEEQKLIFNPGINESITKGIIDLIADVLYDDPDYYDEEWLFDMMYAIQLHDGKYYEIRGGTQKEQWVNFFSDLGERKELTKFYYNQLTYLLRKLIDKSGGDHIAELMDNLIGYGLHRQLLILVSGLASNKSFDKYYWAKQLIERASSDIKNETYLWLVYDVGLNNPLETIEIIKNWLPQNKAISKYSPSNHYSCYFFVHFFTTELLDISQEELERSKDRISILLKSEANIEGTRELIRFILKQFFEDGTKHQFTRSNSILISIMKGNLLCFPWVKSKSVRKFLGIAETESDNYGAKKDVEEYETLIADIIECWYYVISVQQNLPGDIKEQLITVIFKELFKETDQKTMHKLISHWQQKPKYYLHELQRLKAVLKEYLNDEEKKALTGFAKTLQERTQYMVHFFDEINKYY